jgi:hypothetical protein
MPEQTIPPSVEAFRVGYRGEYIGPSYSGWAHFAFTSTASLSVILFASSRVHGVAWWEWLIVPLSFFIANLGEYLGHRGPMHRPRRFMRLLFKRHTLAHHHFFTHEAMAYESTRDFKMVLFPPVMLFFFLGCLATPIGLALSLCLSENAGWLFFATAISYFLTYEWLHMSYHLPSDSWVGRLPLMAVLRRHHTRHHDLALMGRYNFNITFPICDWLMGTLCPEMSTTVAQRTLFSSSTSKERFR